MAGKRSATEANESARSAASDGCIRRNARDLRFESSSNDVDAGAGGSPAAFTCECVEPDCPRNHPAAPRSVVALYHVPKSLDLGPFGWRARGSVHLHVTEDVKLGRLKRVAGECLCAKRRGSCERPLHEGEGDSTFRCERCYEVAELHGIPWPTSLGVAA